MSDPYREQDVRCPCGAPLRGEGEGLRCDACGGVLAPTAELAASLTDLTKLPLAIAFTSERPGELACPRCAKTMLRCRIDVRFDNRNAHPWRSVFRCAADGVWFPAGRYARFVALVERKANAQYRHDLPGRPPGMFSMR